MIELGVGVVLAIGLVAFVLYPILTGRHAPFEDRGEDPPNDP